MDNSVPIYKQLINQIEISILAGEMKPGERLPSVRDFAVQFKVNPNTLQRALAELESRGLIYTERTNGKFVTMDTALIDATRLAYAKKLTAEYQQNMRKIGLGDFENDD